MTGKPIGVFDSGYGGLTVLKELVNKLPQYDYLYLGDNARAPYGTRSYQTVYQYTLECVKWFFEQGCSLIILACNTASAKALRTIQQNDLPLIDSVKRVLGVIRPSAEVIGNFTKTNCIGVLGTTGTVQSNSYPIEINKIYPEIKVFQQACPMWVPLVENNEHETPGAYYFVEEYIKTLLLKSPGIDTILLACTHYPLMINSIKKFVSSNIQIISQGKIVADSLSEYFIRHPVMAELCSKNATITLCTTDSAKDFDDHTLNFFGTSSKSIHVDLSSISDKLSLKI